MSAGGNSPRASWARLTSAVSGSIAIAIGLFVLVGWAVHSTFLIQIAPQLPPMQRNAAVGIALAGVAILALLQKRRGVVYACSAVLCAIGSLTLLEYALSADLRIDQLLGHDYIQTLVAAPGRMSPLTALYLTAIAGACFCAQVNVRRGVTALGVIGLAMVASGVTCAVAAIEGVSNPFVWGRVTQMAVHTAGTFVFLGIALTFLAWDMIQPATRVPIWISVGSGLAVAIMRLGIWQTLTLGQHRWIDFLSIVTLVLGLVSAVFVGAFVHLLLKAYFQGRSLKLVNQRLEQEIADRREAERVAEEANRAKSDFLANMSHEIRTPMTGVLGMIDLVRFTELSAQQKQHLDLARSSADSLLSLLNEILDLSKIEAGRLELNLAPFSIRRCVEDTVSMFKLKAREKNLQLSAEVAAEVPDWLAGDALRLRQVLVNLVGNAVKFTERGSVSVRVSLQAETSTDFGVLIEVRDTGIGIPAEKHRLIFDAFRQSDGSTTRRYGGTGLGLTISARLVELMGGRIKLQSQPGQGSTFSFAVRFTRASLPAPAVPESPDAAPAPASHDTRRFRILIAEDNVVNQKLLAELLRREGHETEVVGNGHEAVAAVERTAFDLVFMDVQMPEMDGFAATGEIRRREARTRRRLPIIAVTANAMKGDQQHCIEAGMDDYISKPVNLQDLRAMLEKRALTPAHPQSA